jgi:hypothetical protein
VEMFGEVGRRAYSGQKPRRRCSFASAGIEGAVESRPDLISMCLFVLYELIIICACDERHTTMHNYALVPLCQCCLMLFVQKYSTQVIAIIEGYESTSPDFQFRHYKAL